MASGVAPRSKPLVKSKALAKKGLSVFNAESMTVGSLLIELQTRGFIVDRAIGMAIEREFLYVPVIQSTRYRTCAGKAFGRSNNRKIVLSHLLWMAPGNAWINVHKTFIHELAHLLAWGDGHGSTWKRICKQIGGDGIRCHNYKEMQKRQPKEIAACYTCDKKWHGRKGLAKNRNYTCPKCGEKITRVKKGENV
jgi:predicted SprT family Zn-dependent metalloprotease